MSLYNSQLYANNYYMLRGLDDYQKFINILWAQSDMWTSLHMTIPDNRSSLITNSFYFPFKIGNYNKLGTEVDRIRFGYEYSESATTNKFLYIDPSKTSFKIFFNFTFSKTELQKYLTNSFLDYDTINEYKLYLPFIGIVNIDGKLIYDLAHTIYINYYADISTGACSCNICLDDVNNRLYQYTVNCTNISPYSGTNNTYVANKGWGTIGSIISSAVGFTVPTTITSGGKTKTTARNPSTGRQITTGTEEQQYKTIKRHETSSAYDLINGFVDLATSQIPTSINGSSSPDISFDSLLCPYIIIKKPKAIYYTGYDKLNGRPLNESRVLKHIRGYTEISSIHLNIPCLSNELEEIEDLLHTGVILNTDVEIPDVPPVTPTPEPETPATPEPEEPTPTPDLPEGETAKMLCCFNGKFRVTGIRGTPAETGRIRNHYGLDLVGMNSTNVYAISSGWVKITNTGSSGLGKCVHVQMDDPKYYGQWILYGHLSSFAVANKQYVNKGQLLGVMGNTGESRGYHTHLEWRNKYDQWDSDFSKYNICEFTGIPNISTPGQNVFIGSPIYKTTNGESVQKKLGLENQTIQYLENYTYAEDLMRKIDDHTK